MGGAGIIIRDANGNPIGASSLPGHYNSTEEGEVLAFRSGLLEAIASGYDSILIETDCKQLINYIEGEVQPPMSIEPLIQDILYLFDNFMHCFPSYIPRSSNVIADLLARKALSVSGPKEWPLSSQWLVELCTPSPPARFE